MKMKNRMLSLILAVMIASQLFCITSCYDSGAQNEIDEPSGTVSDKSDFPNTAQSESVGHEESRLMPSLLERDFGGADFRMLSTSPMNYGGGYVITDLTSEGLTGEGLNDAVFHRNNKISDEYKVKIVCFNSQNNNAEITKSNTSGEGMIDIAFNYHILLYQMIIKNQLSDLRQMPYIDIDMPWWDKNCTETFTLYGKSYITIGDISTTEDRFVRCIFFNKNLAEQFGVNDPYTLVKEDNWSMDTFREEIEKVSNDANGDGLMNDGEVFGFVTESALPLYLFIGADGSFTKKNEDGEYYVSVYSERNLDITHSIFELCSDKKHTILMESFKNIGRYAHCYAYARALFTQDKFLFTVQGASATEIFRDMESEYGILPMPKYDEAQKNFCHLVDPQTPLMVILLVLADSEKTGIITEALAAESRYTVTPEYVETMLKRKYARDNKSSDMLDIIADTKAYEIAFVIGLDMIYRMYWTTEIEPTASSMKGKIKAANKTLEKQIRKLSDENDK